jgi:hypothetical protein
MDPQRTKHAAWSWEAAGAFCCFSGGIGAAVVGTVLTGVAWVLGAQFHPWLHGLGTAFLVVTIPLLIFSGYCLDWEEERSRSKGAREVHNASQR